MADAKQPKLTLVDAAMAEVGPMDKVADVAVQRVLERYTPSIAKRVRADVTAEFLRKVGAGTIEEISSLPHLRASFEREEAKHVRGAKREGIVLGLVLGLVLMSLVFVVVIRQMTDMAYEQAQRSTQQGALIGAAAASQDPAQRGHDTPHLSAP